MARLDEVNLDEFDFDSPDGPGGGNIRSTKNMTGILIITFGSLNEALFGQRLHMIAAGMTDNVDFPEPWWVDPAELPTVASLTADADDLDDLQERADDGDKAAKIDYKTKRTAITADLKKLAAYLELQAEGDRAKLEGTGYELRRPRTHTGGPGPLPAPETVKLKRGTLSGVIVARCTSVKGAGSYETQITTGDVLVEANWHTVAQTKGCGRIEITGLTAGTIYKVRIRAIGARGPGAWADVASLMAV